MKFCRQVLLGLLLFPSLALAAPSKKNCAEILSRPVRFAENSTVSKEWLQSMQRRPRSSSQKALDQAVQNSGYKSIALNREVMSKHSASYSHELQQGCVTTQEQSGRCWIFAGNNMLRAALLGEQKVAADFNLSFNHLHFFSMLERANLWISKLETSEAKKTPRKEGVFSSDIGDGGWFTWYQFLVKKYGLVPQSAMMETAGGTNTSMLLNDIQAVLTGAGLQIKRLAERWNVSKAGKYNKTQQSQLLKVRQEAMEKIYTILVTHLGQPPDQFTHEGKQYTPESFRDDFVEFDASEFVVIFNNPRLPYGKTYEIKDAALAVTSEEGPSSTETVLNLPFRRMDQLIQKSVKSGTAVWFATSVSSMLDASPTSPSKPTTGIWHPDLYQGANVYGLSEDDFHYRRVDRMELRLSMPTHAMLITGFDKPDPKSPTVKYKVENSWSQKWADGGFGHMYREWAEIYLDAIVVHRSVLTEKEKQALSAKAKSISSDDFF